MTITTTLQKFENLKKIVLEDGKIDKDEVEVLLDFIAPYCRSGNKKFSDLHKILIESKDDDSVKKNSKTIIQSIEDVSKFLKVEKTIETFLAGFLGIGFISFIIIALIRYCLN